MVSTRSTVKTVTIPPINIGPAMSLGGFREKLRFSGPKHQFPIFPTSMRFDCQSANHGKSYILLVNVIKSTKSPYGAKTLHPVESRYGKISQESFNLLSSDRSSSKKMPHFSLPLITVCR